MMNCLLLFQQNSPTLSVCINGIFMNQKVGHIFCCKDLEPDRDFGIESTLGDPDPLVSRE